MSIIQSLQEIVPVAKLNRDGVPSASVAVMENGDVSAGVIGKGKENNDTVYQACSISKAITALAVAKLVDQGRFSYESKVEEHLAQSTVECLVDSKTAHLIEHVTVAMLLSHTSGLSQHGFPGYSGPVPKAEEILSGRPPSNTPQVHFESFPSAQFSYSGGGFTILQLFLESIMKQSFPEMMQEVLLKPLNMTRSWYGDVPRGEKNYATAHMTGYLETEAKYHNFIELAAAGLWTTPSDLLKAVTAIQDSLYTDSGFLTRETAKKMLTGVKDISGLFGGVGNVRMALGWVVDDHAFAHSGDNIPGYNTYVLGLHGGALNPSSSHTTEEKRSGISIMINSDWGHKRALKQIVGAAFYAKEWPRYGSLPLYGNDEYVPYAAPQGTSISGDWKRWIGKWDSNWEIVDQDGPALVFNSFPPMRLVPAAASNLKDEQGREEHMLVADGLRIGVRLMWKDNDPVVELLQGEDGQSQILKRI